MTPTTHDGLHAVFAYGSNMCLRDLARWLNEKGHGGLAPAHAEEGLLLDHQLVWNYRSPVRRGGAANVERMAEDHAAGIHLPGVLLHVDAALLRAIDEKEGHPERYVRSERIVEVSGGPRRAWVYEVAEAWRHDQAIWPRRGYLDVMLRGAREHGLPERHIRDIGTTPTRDESDG